MFKSSIDRNLVSTWLLPIVSAVLGLSVIAVIWLLPQVKEEGVWHDMSAPIEERIVQETFIKPTSTESSSSDQVAEPSGDGITQLTPKESDTVAIQELESQTPATEMKEQTLTGKQAEQKEDQKEAPIAEQQDTSKPVPTNSPTSNGLINVNQASADELTELPGIGPSKAKAIIQYREKYGPFQKMEELLEVKGIGSKILDKMRSKISLGP